MNRKSVIGLESRLEKVAQDTQKQMLNLQEELERARDEKTELEFKITQLINKNSELNETLPIERKKNDNLQIKLMELNKQIFNLKDEKSTAIDENVFLNTQNSKLENQLHRIDKEIIELKHDKKNLQSNFSKEQDHCKKLVDKIEVIKTFHKT